MPREKNDHYESIATSSEEIVRACRQSIEDEDNRDSLAVVHYRGGKTEFDLGCKYASSDDPLDRVTGAYILSQLGWGDDTFHDESVDILLRLATDKDERVIVDAVYALGHRKSPRGIPVILPLIDHTNVDIRQAAVSGLTCQDDPAAIQGLIRLANDENRDVRNWAAFGLGTMTDVDSSELRNALAPLLEDSDPEIRGEAMIGLAKRHDPRALPAVIRELEGEFHGDWCLEAAEFLADPQLLPLLEQLRDSIPASTPASHFQYLEGAIAACAKK